MSTKKGIGAAGLFIVGAAAGYVTSLFVDKKYRNKHKRKIQEVLDSVDWDDLSQKILGSSGQEATDKVKGAVKRFQEMINRQDSKSGSVNAAKYKDLIASFGSKLEEDGDFTKAQIKKLTSYLESDYKQATRRA